MKRWQINAAIITALILALIGGLLAVGWWWLTTTRSGAEWLLDRAAGAVPSLEWQSLEGGLAGGIVLRGVQLDEAGSQVRIDKIELAARVALLSGPKITVDWLRVNDVDVYLPPADLDAPDDAPFLLPDLASPFPVQVDELLITHFRLYPHEGEEPLVELDRLNLAGRYHDTLVLDDLVAELAQGRLEADGQWQLSAPHQIRLSLNIVTSLDAIPEHRISAEIDGTTDDLNVMLETSGPMSLSGPIRLNDVMADPRVDAQLTGEFRNWPDLDFTVNDLSLEASGTPQAWRLDLGLVLDGPQVPDNRIQAELAGSLTQATLDSLSIQTLDGEIQANGELDWDEPLRARLAMTLDQLDLVNLYPEWPQQARLNGELVVTSDGETLILQSLDLNAPPSALTVSGSGRYDPTSDDLGLELAWNAFAWPPVTDQSEPLVSSESGEIRLTGRLSDWQAEVQTLLKIPDQPQARIDASIRGSERHANIASLNLDASELGRVQASGEIHWEPELGGQLDLNLDAIDPGRFIRQLPGQVSGQLVVAFDTIDDITLTITNLNGQLRGQDLAGSGRVRMLTEVPEAGRLDLSLGDNRFELASDDGRLWQWQVDAAELQQLWPDLSGELKAEGLVEPFDGRVTMSGQIRSGGLDDVTVDQIDLQADVRWHEPTRADVRLTLANLDLNPWERIDELELSLDGSCRAHQFRLNMTGERANLDLGGSGSLPDCLRGGTAWDGRLNQFYLANTAAGDWRLDNDLVMQIGPGQIRADPACLVEAAGQGKLCLDELTIAEQASATLSIDQVPMDLLLLAINPTFQLTTPLSGELSADWVPGSGIEEFGGYLALAAGELRPKESDLKLLGIEAVRLDLTPSGRGVLAELDARLEGDSMLRGSVGMDDINQPNDATVNGDLRLNLPDIGVFNRLVAELDNLGGRLEGDLAIRGRLNAPQLDGQARLVKGTVVHAPLGLNIENIELTLEGSNAESTLTGRMVSGDGHLNINGSLRPDGNRWVWSLAAEGEQFSFADVTWLQIQASPRISLDGRGERMTIDGDIGIDHLRAGMPPGTEDRVTTSEDVVVLGETEPEEDSSDLKLNGRLGIDLGSDARLDAVGLQTSLEGDVELLWDRNSSLPRGRGIVSLTNGSYQAYGQNLEINDGEIILTGHPIDNPRLDIQAIRDIFGDAQVEQAGVTITGNARNPEIRLFTNPPTSEEKALAYVATGADFDHAAGQGAINVGFYLLPKLFVSYGIGLFESGNVLSGRYELSRRWGVRVVSGERDTGVDLSYSVDR